MSLEVVLRAEILPTEWDAIVRNSQDGWVFALSGWQELILNVEQWGLEDFSFGLYDGSRLVAVVPLQFNSANGRMSSSGWGGAGPIVGSSFTGKARNRILKIIVEHCLNRSRVRGAAQFDFSISPVTQTSVDCQWGVNPYIFHGLEDRSGISQIIDLRSSEEELWEGLSTDARRQIRIARDHGFTVERANWQESLDHYYCLHEETYRRTGVQPHPKTYFAGMALHTAPTGNSILWLARSATGAVVAYHNSACLGVGGSYHTGCSNDEAGTYGVGYLLFWEVLLGVKTIGMHWYECGPIFPGSTDPKQQGLSTFKTKFGGQPHRSFICVKPLQLSAVAAPEAKPAAPGRWSTVKSRVLSTFTRLQ